MEQSKSLKDILSEQDTDGLKSIRDLKEILSHLEEELQKREALDMVKVETICQLFKETIKHANIDVKSFVDMRIKTESINSGISKIPDSLFKYLNVGEPTYLIEEVKQPYASGPSMPNFGNPPVGYGPGMMPPPAPWNRPFQPTAIDEEERELSLSLPTLKDMVSRF